METQKETRPSWFAFLSSSNPLEIAGDGEMAQKITSRLIKMSDHGGREIFLRWSTYHLPTRKRMCALGDLRRPPFAARLRYQGLGADPSKMDLYNAACYIDEGSPFELINVNQNRVLFSFQRLGETYLNERGSFETNTQALYEDFNSWFALMLPEGGKRTQPPLALDLLEVFVWHSTSLFGQLDFSKLFLLSDSSNILLLPLNRASFKSRQTIWRRAAPLITFTPFSRLNLSSGDSAILASTHGQMQLSSGESFLYDYSLSQMAASLPFRVTLQKGGKRATWYSQAMDDREEEERHVITFPSLRTLFGCLNCKEKISQLDLPFVFPNSGKNPGERSDEPKTLPGIPSADTLTHFYYHAYFHCDDLYRQDELRILLSRKKMPVRLAHDNIFPVVRLAAPPSFQDLLPATLVLFPPVFPTKFPPQNYVSLETVSSEPTRKKD